jgi:hypothetical protein
MFGNKTGYQLSGLIKEKGVAVMVTNKKPNI